MIPKPIWEPIPLGQAERFDDDIDPLVANEVFECVFPEDVLQAPDEPKKEPKKQEEKVLYVEEHHVILKELGATTLATRLFKDHTRAIIPRSKAFNMDKLVALQNQCYHCKYHSKTSSNDPPLQVRFWVSWTNATKHPEWTLDITEIRYDRNKKKSVRYVPASEACIRHEINTNGGRTPQKRAQKKTVKSAARLLEKHKTTTKWFHVQGSTNLEEDLKRSCEAWIQQSPDRFDRGLREKMVEQFWQDFHQEKKICTANPLVSRSTVVDDYDKLRKTAHDTLLVHIANEFGNAMVDWYHRQRGRLSKQSKP